MERERDDRGDDMRERDIERAFARRVRELGGEVRKVRWIGRRHAPDRVALLPFLFAGTQTVWVELKATGERPSRAQAREHDRMRRAGQEVLVISSIAQIDEAFPL
jgi:hypothetical protein